MKRPPIHVCFVLLPGSLILDWAGPAEAFRIANQLLAASGEPPRHLTRLFVAHAGVAPLEYLRHTRLAAARAALESGRNVTQAAELAGFSSDTQLRRPWCRFGQAGSPSGAGLLQNL